MVVAPELCDWDTGAELWGSKGGSSDRLISTQLLLPQGGNILARFLLVVCSVILGNPLVY